MQPQSPPCLDRNAGDRIGSAAQGELIVYRAVASNQVSKTLGSGSDHGIVFGVWSELLIGEWGAVQVTVDPYTKAGQDVTRVLARAFVDIDLRHPQAFCTGATLTA
jgi:HK97 family phage major capsid protein